MKKFVIKLSINILERFTEMMQIDILKGISNVFPLDLIQLNLKKKLN